MGNYTSCLSQLASIIIKGTLTTDIKVDRYRQRIGKATGRLARRLSMTIKPATGAAAMMTTAR